jgi:hypothetical protein
MWDIGSGECLHVLVGHVAAVRCVQYDGRLVVSGAYDYMVKVTNCPLGPLGVYLQVYPSTDKYRIPLGYSDDDVF